MLKGKILWFMALLVLGFGYWLWQSQPSPEITMPKVSATIGEKKFWLYSPSNDEERQRGLAAFDKIGADEGMIFRGLPEGKQTFWMKDMKFDIDILWVNKSNEVVHILYDASKDSYPTTFENPSTRPSSYVIELAAGASEKNGIAPGSIVKLSE